MSAGSPRGNSIDVLIGIPHLWTSASVVQGVKRMECKYCRKLILAGGFICEVCSFPIHKQCMLKDNIISCGNVAPYQLQQRAKLAHFLEKRPPKINSKARAAVSRTTWQRRWFILTKDCNIFYYKEKTSSTPKGVISLTKYDTVESLPKRKMRLYNQTDASVREYHLRAPSEEIQSLWVKEIENLIEQGKKGILGLAQDLHTREVNSRMNQTTKTVPKLKVKVTEGKNFPTSLSGMSPSVYCIISCGFEFRQTLTIWNSESPVWDEEYDLENFDPDKDVFRCFVMEDNLLLTDSDIGIVEKPVSSLGLEVHDKWCPIQAPPLQHVTGDIHIQLARRGNVLTVMILECNHLAAQDPNGLSDPYVTLACGSVKKKTQIIKKNLNPYFGEAFQFNVEESVLPIEVVVWDWDRIGLNDFLGQVIIPESDIPKSGRCDKRYLLEPQKVSAKAPDESKSLGELRLRLVYTEQRVYPLTVYLSLLGLLMAQDIPFVKALVPIIPDKAAVAACLVKIFDSNLESLRLVQDLTSTEIEATDDPSIIFRGNTLITKSMDSFMKYSGGSYLRLILGPLVTEVNNLNQSYEVDPLKASSGEDVSKNAAKLATLCQNFLDRIFNSVPHCPLVMKAAFTHIRSIVMSKYTKDQILVVKYTSVSAFIFLRFFCPAIQNPKSHGLVERLTPTTARTFTLVAKILQNLANLVEFGEKEPYMKRLNIFIVDNKEQMKVFLNNISLVKDIPDTKIGISEDLWLEKELSTMTQFLTASFDQISNTLEPSLLHEFHTVMNQMKTAMEEQDLLEAEGS